MVERIDSSRIVGADADAVAQFIENDFKIRSGVCPNGHGLLNPLADGQECKTCGFYTNTSADKAANDH